MKEVELKQIAKFDLVVKAGSTLDFTVLVTAGGTPVDWSTYSFLCQIKREKSAKSPVLATIDVAPTTTPGELRFQSADSALLPPGNYVADVRATIGTGPSAVIEYPIEFQFEFSQTATYPIS